MANLIEDKSFDFALEIVRICRCLRENKREFILSTQLMKAGTSIGANIAEAQQAQSKADFISKMNISLKEATETRYWLRLIRGSGYIGIEETEEVYKQCEELIRMLTAIIKTSKLNS